MSEIELILTKLKIVSEEKENGMYLCDKEHSKILLNYIQQKENIIKEVREYIEYMTKQFENFEDKELITNRVIDISVLEKILEILDKKQL